MTLFPAAGPRPAACLFLVAREFAASTSEEGAYVGCAVVVVATEVEANAEDDPTSWVKFEARANGCVGISPGGEENEA